MENLPNRDIDLRPFGGLKFVESTHTYINDKGKVYKGMSTFCKNFSEPFDGEGIARYKAIKNVLNEKTFNELKRRVGGWQNIKFVWDKLLNKNEKLKTLLQEEKNNILKSWNDSTTDGSLEHDKRERDIIKNGFNYNRVLYKFLDKNITQITKSDIGVVTELMVWDHTLELCGLVDLCIFDKGKIHILDYKTNKEITTSGFNGKRLYEPFTKFEECSLSKYSIQLRGYLELAQRLTGFEKGNCEIIWTSSKKYKRELDKYIPTLELDNELKIALKNYENGIRQKG